ncbi:hypothetical protein KTR9_1337 [Gordonia sp. KTR9]|nr:hypothetical protein KTR9_1337 [Gordonia sp. KTR9]
MTISRLWFHEFRKPSMVQDLPLLPDGRDLIDVFEAHANLAKSSSLVRNRNETYAVVTNVDRDDRALTVTFRSGRFGEDGEITDVGSGASRGTFRRTDATTVITHGVLLVPRSGTSALAFTERSGGFGGMSHLVETFNEWFDGVFHDHRMKRDTVVQSDAWLKRADLMKVTGTIRKHKSDIATDGQDEVLGTLKHVIEPGGREKYFPRRLRDRLMENKINRNKFLAFDESDVVDEIDITLGDGDQEKTFEIDDEKTPTLRLVLTKSGESPLSAEKVKKRAMSEAADIFAHYDVEWVSS